MSYVDGFLLPVPKKNLAAYRRMSQKAGKLWREHGALEYRECVGDDLKVKMGVSFPKPQGQGGETVVFSWIVTVRPTVTASTQVGTPGSRR
jgi:uncharacterized protein YbaA (DUF1428 family)